MGRLILIIMVLFSVTAIYSEASAVEEPCIQTKNTGIIWQASSNWSEQIPASPSPPTALIDQA